MNILQISILIFVFIECLNVAMLYMMPQSKMGNGVGIFDAFFKVQEEGKYVDFVSYLINWVAGTKLIFIMMGLVAVIFGNEKVHIFSVVALILSILSFYFRLFPLIKKMDKLGEISPKGYAKTLNMMIMSFLLMFIISLVIYLITH